MICSIHFVPVLFVDDKFECPFCVAEECADVNINFEKE